MNRLVWCALLALTACGTLPLGSAPVPDVRLVVPATLQLPITITTPVVYLRENQFGGQGIPSLVNSVGIQGTAQYSGAGEVQQVEVYVRPDLNDLPSCLAFPDDVICLGDESAQSVGVIDVQPHSPTAVTLEALRC